MYTLEVREHVDRIFKKLARKNRNQMEIEAKKIQEILADPHRFKPMRFPLGGMRRVHFGSFVLLFSMSNERPSLSKIMNNMTECTGQTRFRLLRMRLGGAGWRICHLKSVNGAAGGVYCINEIGYLPNRSILSLF